METWRADVFAEAGVTLPFVQDNQSSSRQGVLRGLHYQIQQPQGKLVRVISGRVFDVAVDLRRSSPTFGRWVGAELSAENHRQFWVPPGFGHGFYVLSEQAEFVYKCTDYYAPEHERTHPLGRPRRGHRLAAGAGGRNRAVGQGSRRGGAGRSRTVRLSGRAAAGWRPNLPESHVPHRTGLGPTPAGAGAPLRPGRRRVPRLPGRAARPFGRRRGLPRPGRRPAGCRGAGGHRPAFSRHRSPLGRGRQPGPAGAREGHGRRRRACWSRTSTAPSSPNSR